MPSLHRKLRKPSKPPRPTPPRHRSHRRAPAQSEPAQSEPAASSTAPAAAAALPTAQTEPAATPPAQAAAGHAADPADTAGRITDTSARACCAANIANMPAAPSRTNQSQGGALIAQRRGDENGRDHYSRAARITRQARRTERHENRQGRARCSAERGGREASPGRSASSSTKPKPSAKPPVTASPEQRSGERAQAASGRRWRSPPPTRTRSASRNSRQIARRG